MMIKTNQYILFEMILLVLAIVLDQALVLHDFISGCLYGSSIGVFILSLVKKKTVVVTSKSFVSKRAEERQNHFIVN